MRSIAKLTRPLSEKFVLGRSPRRPPAAFAALRGRAMLCIATGFSPKLGRDLPMTAAATPCGRPQYAAQRDEIAPSASGDRCRGWRRLAHSYGVQIPYLLTNARTPGPKNCSAPPLRPTVIVRAPGEIIPDKLIVYRLDFLLRRGARGLFRSPAGISSRLCSRTTSKIPI